jgi:hypothetical protein
LEQTCPVNAATSRIVVPDARQTTLRLAVPNTAGTKACRYATGVRPPHVALGTVLV